MTLAERIVPAQPVEHPTGHLAELIRRAQAAGYVSLVEYVAALETEVHNLTLDARIERFA